VTFMVMMGMPFVSRKASLLPWRMRNIRGTQMLDDKEWERLRWQCRRGMLELDVILRPFMDEDLPQLSERIQRGFVRLLESSDLELFRWLLRGESPVDAEFRELIEVIRDHHQTRHLG